MANPVNLWTNSTDARYKEWIDAKRPEEMIQKYKTHADFTLALRAMEASHPVLERFGSGMIGEVGDIPCFIGVLVDATGNAETSLVVADEDDESKMYHLKSYGTQGKELAAAFVCCFPEANFLYQNTKSGSGAPQRMILITKDPNGKMSIHKHVMTLSILKEFFVAGEREFFVGCT